MIRFIMKRFFYGILVLFGVLTVVFMLFAILPGDPARMITGQHADQETIKNIRKELGLDKPIFKQYLFYINDVSPVSIHFATDFDNSWTFFNKKYGKTLPLIKTSEMQMVVKKPYLRQSWQSKRSVMDVLAEAFPKTILLAVVSILFAMVAGVGIGAFVAMTDNKIVNRLVIIITVFGMSLPSFFAAILIAWVFAFLLADYTGLSMFGSLYSVDHYGNGSYLDLKNLILPAFTLGIRPLAIVTELTRTSLSEVLSQDYIRTAYAKGLKKTRIILFHALRNALNPVVTAVSGWFASLLAGAVFVEYVFDWKGIGVVIVDALEKFDLPVLMGSVLMIAFMLIIINIFVDIVYGFLDPRIRIA
ncbi:MAG: peptide/nickel transport system permease protein [Bacteroidetes bacterium]|nr:MAG: peptide/nickel transport system permease protein [Bacteroidota bacterium]